MGLDLRGRSRDGCELDFGDLLGEGTVQLVDPPAVYRYSSYQFHGETYVYVKKKGFKRAISKVRDLVLYVFHQDRALVAAPAVMSQRRHQPTRVDLQQRLRLLVRIDLDVLIVHPFRFEGYPHPLHERAGMSPSLGFPWGLVVR